MTKLLLALAIAGAAFAQTSAFPTAIDSNATLGAPADNVSSALTSPILIGDTVANVANATNIPQWSLVTFGAELVQVCLKVGNALTLGTPNACPSISGRGLSGTTVAAHNTGVIGYLNINAFYHQAATAGIIAVESATPNVVSDLAVASFAAGCASGGRNLLVSRVWTALTTQSCAAPVEFKGGGMIQPANGQTVTIQLAAAPLAQICDVSLGGNCIISTQTGVVLPEWWGAVAGSDSTAAWQAMFNTVSGTNNSIHVYARSNDGQCYKIATTLTHTGNNLQSLNIEGTLLNGQATGASCLQWIGAAAGTLMRLTNEVTPVIRNMEFKGNALAKTDVLFQSDGSNFNVFSLVIDHSSFAGMIGAGSSGLQLDALPCVNPNVSGITIRDSIFAGNVTGLDTGILSPCGGNSKNITIEGGSSRFTNLGTGIDFFGGNDGYVLISGVYFGANLVRDINVAVGNVVIQSTDSEGSLQMVQIGAGTNHCTLQVRGASWSGITDANDRVISSTGCSLEITGSEFTNQRVPGTSLPKITLNAGLQPNCAPFCGGPALVSHNNLFINTDATHGAYYDSGGSAICVPYGGYFSVNNQASAECFGDYGGVNSFTMVKLPDYSPLAPRQFTPGGVCIPPEVAYDTSGANFCTALNTWSQAPYMTSGTFTPTLTFGGATTGIVQVNTGMYTRLGHTVTVNLTVRLSNVGTAVGVALITGLPFTTAESDSGSIGFFNGFAGSITVTPTILANVGFASLGLFKAVTGVQLANTDFTNASFVSLTLAYQTP